ncbi:MAG: response regulator [Elusimicrobia bacterium]|nr:response regulator [Elusimicrobiota bacterium]
MLHILSSEDDPMVRTMLSGLLSGEGHEVEFAANSDALFKLLPKRVWDLVILDVNVPGMNGYQIAQEICARYGEKRPKMLLFTGRDTQAEKAQVVLSEVDAVLEKGTPLPMLVETINRLTGLSGAPRPASAPIETKAGTGPAAASAVVIGGETAVSRDEIERLKMRIGTTLNENASVSQRIEAVQKRVADLEKLLRGLQKETSEIRTRTERLAVMTGIVGAAVGLALILTKR